MSSGSLTQREARAQFPALDSGFIFLENAGGSQVPLCVIHAMEQFLREDYVQTGAGYPASDRATSTVTRAHQFCELLMGAEDRGRVVLGASTTQLTHMLADCISRTLEPGDEIVVSTANHEANAGPWERLARIGANVKWWAVDPKTGDMEFEGLANLLTKRTKIVALPHTSNLLGNIVDVRQATDIAHQVGAKVVVDGVAFAPHRLMEVGQWGVDFYVYSTYKVFGPHMAALFGRHEAWAELEGPNHYFVPRGEVPRKFELGSLNYEGCAGVVALGSYLTSLVGASSLDRGTVARAFERIREWEHPLTERLLRYLCTKPSVRVVGPFAEPRVPTVSFVSDRTTSPDIASRVAKRGIGIRHGHMYAHRLTEALGVDPETGFVRVSAVHTNTTEELDQLFETLDAVL